MQKHSHTLLPYTTYSHWTLLHKVRNAIASAYKRLLRAEIARMQDFDKKRATLYEIMVKIKDYL